MLSGFPAILSRIRESKFGGIKYPFMHWFDFKNQDVFPFLVFPNRYGHMSARVMPTVPATPTIRTKQKNKRVFLEKPHLGEYGFFLTRFFHVSQTSNSSTLT